MVHDKNEVDIANISNQEKNKRHWFDIPINIAMMIVHICLIKTLGSSKVKFDHKDLCIYYNSSDYVSEFRTTR